MLYAIKHPPKIKANAHHAGGTTQFTTTPLQRYKGPTKTKNMASFGYRARTDGAKLIPKTGAANYGIIKVTDSGGTAEQKGMMSQGLNAHSEKRLIGWAEQSKNVNTSNNKPAPNAIGVNHINWLFTELKPCGPCDGFLKQKLHNNVEVFYNQEIKDQDVMFANLADHYADEVITGQRPIFVTQWNRKQRDYIYMDMNVRIRKKHEQKHGNKDFGRSYFHEAERWDKAYTEVGQEFSKHFGDKIQHPNLWNAVTNNMQIKHGQIFAAGNNGKKANSDPFFDAITKSKKIVLKAIDIKQKALEYLLDQSIAVYETDEEGSENNPIGYPPKIYQHLIPFSIGEREQNNQCKIYQRGRNPLRARPYVEEINEDMIDVNEKHDKTGKSSKGNNSFSNIEWVE